MLGHSGNLIVHHTFEDQCVTNATIFLLCVRCNRNVQIKRIWAGFNLQSTCAVRSYTNTHRAKSSLNSRVPPSLHLSTSPSSLLLLLSVFSPVENTQYISIHLGLLFTSPVNVCHIVWHFYQTSGWDMGCGNSSPTSSANNSISKTGESHSEQQGKKQKTCYNCTCLSLSRIKCCSVVCKCNLNNMCGVW